MLEMNEESAVVTYTKRVKTWMEAMFAVHDFMERMPGLEQTPNISINEHLMTPGGNVMLMIDPRLSEQDEVNPNVKYPTHYIVQVMAKFAVPLKEFPPA